MKFKKYGLIIAALLAVAALIWIIFSLFINRDENRHSNSPTITLNIPAESLEQVKDTKVLEVSVQSTNTDKIERVEYLIDGKVVARSTEPPYHVSVSINKLKPGQHTLQAIAYVYSGKPVKSKLFKFIVKDNEIIPSDKASEEIVEQSVSFASQKKSSSSKKASSSNGSNSSGSDNGGAQQTATRTAGGWWASLPAGMQVCSNNVWNGGPSSAPARAITVPAGDNSGFSFNQANKTFWFAPGEHTLGSGQYSQITPGTNSTYIGAPGAILDGKNLNLYAFSGTASNVRLAYLEIRNFGTGNSNNNEGVINHDSGTGWTMEYLYAHHNDGAAVFIGTDNIVRNSCLKDNGQYGFSMFKNPIDGDSAIKNITIDNNEITGNNQDDWETQIDGCGCTGGGKFWDVQGASVTNNYVHDNLSTGLWADTNDIDFLFDSNWIEHNSGEGIWYEISYNATISRNVLKRNAWASGNNNTGSPAPAIYISESGGDSRLASATSGSTNLQIKNNLLQDNFSGVSIFENSNRFCNSNGNTSKTYCTPFVSPTQIPAPYDYNYPNPINNTHPCYTNVSSAPYTNNCRWHSKNVQVFNNEFRFDENAVPCAGTYCGVQALFATGSDNISWAPSAYGISTVQNNVMFNNNNKFYNNAYFGNWRFAKGYGEKIYFNEWTLTPFLQDTGSTFDGAVSPPPVANSLDDDSSTFENSIGHWDDWFSTSPSQSTAEAHSGTHSLKVDITSGGSWGIQLDNHPGFPTIAGSKHVSFWAKQGTAGVTRATLSVNWYNGSGSLLQTDSVPITGLSNVWKEGEANLTAPVGTASVFLEVASSTGTNGDYLYLDDFVVGDN